MARFMISMLGLSLLGAAPLSFEARLLASHNEARSHVGSPPLQWDDALAKSAKSWAEHLARGKTLEHAPPGRGTADQGENLWMGGKGDFSPEEMVAAWVAEKTQFKPGFFPAVTVSGQVDDVGHYTQLVWHATTHVGCATASNDTDDFLVCRYSPPGNVIGQSPLASTKPVKKQRQPVSKKRRRGG